MLCPNCGSEVAGDAEVCARCGCVLEDSVAFDSTVGTADSAGAEGVVPPGLPEGAWVRQPEDSTEASLASLGAGAAEIEGLSGDVGSPRPSRRTDAHDLRVLGTILGTGLAIVAIAGVAFFGGVDAVESPATVVGSLQGADGATDADERAAMADDAAVTDAAEDGPSELAQAVCVPEGWDEACVDVHGCPTVYALTELTGGRLEELMRALGFAWASEEMVWSNGRVALCAFDGQDSFLDEDAIAQLDAGGGAAVYQIATSDYATAEEAYAALVPEPLASVDSVFADGAGFGVAYGPSMVEYLIEATEGDGHVSVFVFGPGPLRAGLFDQLARGSFGSTARESYAAVTGRSLEDAAD